MIYPLLYSNNDRVSFGFIKTCLVLEIHTLFSNNFLKDWAIPRHPDVGESKTNDRKSIQLILESYLSLILLCIAFPCRVSDRNLLLSAMTVEPLYLKHNFEGNKLEQSKWIDLCNWSAYLVRFFSLGIYAHLHIQHRFLHFLHHKDKAIDYRVSYNQVLTQDVSFYTIYGE